MSKFRIKELVIENFKGYKGRHVVQFNPGIIAIYGPVGSGKSSIAQAIEYALYGQQLEIKERIAKLVDLINEEASEARVQLTLEDYEGNVVKIIRHLRRYGDSARETLAELWFNNKKIASTAREVNEKIIEILKLDEDDFSRFVLVTHRVLEGLVYGTPAKRSLVIDRLFGIEMLEQIYKAIPIRKIEEILEREKQKLSSYKELPEILSKYGSIQNAREILEKMKKEIEEYREVESELQRRLEKLIEQRKQILEKFSTVESDYVKYLKIKAEREMLEEELKNYQEVSEKTIRVELDLIKSFLISKLEELLLSREVEELSQIDTTSQNLEDVSMKIFNIVRRLEDYLTKINEEIENLTNLCEELRADSERLSNEIRILERRIREIEDQYREYKSLISKYGTPEHIKQELDRLREKIQSIEEFDRHVEAIISEIVRKGLKNCPICGREIDDNVLENIKSRLEELRKRSRVEELESLQKKVEELEHALSKIKSLKSIVEEYEELYSKVKTLREMYSNVIAKLENAEKNRRILERRSQVIKALIDEIRERIDKVDKNIALLRKFKKLKSLIREERELEEKLKSSGLDLKQLTSLELEIQDISKRLDEVRNRLNSLSIEVSRLERILSSIPVESIEKLRDRVYSLEKLYNQLTNVRSAIRKVQSRLREKMVEKVRDLVDNYFKLMYPYSDMSGAGIELSIKERLGTLVSEYTLYGLRGGRRVPISRMSDGQRLTLSLSFMLSVYVVANHNVDFMIMDEPMPYVDVAIRSSFSTLISKLVKECLVNQLIITSQSREFIDQIIREALKNNINTTLLSIEREDSQRRIKVEKIEHS